MNAQLIVVTDVKSVGTYVVYMPTGVWPEGLMLMPCSTSFWLVPVLEEECYGPATANRVCALLNDRERAACDVSGNANKRPVKPELDWRKICLAYAEHVARIQRHDFLRVTDVGGTGAALRGLTHDETTALIKLARGG